MENRANGLLVFFVTPLAKQKAKETGQNSKPARLVRETFERTTRVEATVCEGL